MNWLVASAHLEPCMCRQELVIYLFQKECADLRVKLIHNCVGWQTCRQRSQEEEDVVVVRAHAEIMCCGGGHSWSRGECRVCSVCGYYTGYGPNCVNTDKYLDPGT